MRALRNAACEYADRGWKVLPLRPGRKEPLGALVPNGKDNATDETSFVIERKQAPRGFAPIGTAPKDATTFEDTTAVPFAKYSYRVRAVGPTGPSDFSNYVNLTMITGLRRDAHKLALALELGVDYVVNVEDEDLREKVAEVTNGEGADIVIDVVPYAASTFVDAIDVVRPGGMVVLAGMKGDVPVPNFFSDHLARKAVTIRGVQGKSTESYRRAVALLESRRFPIERLNTHTFGLADAEKAIEVLAGSVPGENAVFVSLDPSLT